MSLRFPYVAALAAFGCSTLDEVPQEPTDTEQPAPQLSLQDLEPSACAELEYSFLPPQGELLEVVRKPELDFSKILIDGLATEAGYEKLTPFPFSTEAYSFTYTTQDRGELVEATSLLVLPDDGDPPEGGWPVLILTHSFAGLLGACSPSGGSFEEALESLLMAAKGYAVIAPDYIGLDGSILPAAPHAPQVVEQVAIGVWDGYRAGREALEAQGVETRSDVVIWGASQGGHGALAVTRYAPYYAPDVEIKGVVAGTPPIDLRRAFQSVTEEWRSGTTLGVLTMIGYWRWYGFSNSVRDIFVDDEETLFATEVEATIEQLEAEGSESCSFPYDSPPDDPAAWYTPEFLGAIQGEQDLDPWMCAVEENGLNTSPVPLKNAIPTLTVWGEIDDVVVSEAQEASFVELCEQGWPMVWLGCSDANHVDANLWALPESFAFLEARLNGEPLGEVSCEVEAYQRCSAMPEDL